MIIVRMAIATINERALCRKNELKWVTSLVELGLAGRESGDMDCFGGEPLELLV